MPTIEENVQALRDKLCPPPSKEAIVEQILQQHRKEVATRFNSLTAGLVLGIPLLFSSLVPLVYDGLNSTLAAYGWDLPKGLFFSSFLAVYFLLPLVYLVLAGCGTRPAGVLLCLSVLAVLSCVAVWLLPGWLAVAGLGLVAAGMVGTLGIRRAVHTGEGVQARWRQAGRYIRKQQPTRVTAGDGASMPEAAVAVDAGGKPPASHTLPEKQQPAHGMPRAVRLPVWGGLLLCIVAGGLIALWWPEIRQEDPYLHAVGLEELVAQAHEGVLQARDVYAGDERAMALVREGAPGLHEVTSTTAEVLRGNAGRARLILADIDSVGSSLLQDLRGTTQQEGASNTAQQIDMRSVHQKLSWLDAVLQPTKVNDQDMYDAGLAQLRQQVQQETYTLRKGGRERQDLAQRRQMERVAWLETEMAMLMRQQEADDVAWLRQFGLVVQRYDSVYTRLYEATQKAWLVHYQRGRLVGLAILLVALLVVGIFYWRRDRQTMPEAEDYERLQREYNTLKLGILLLVVLVVPLLKPVEESDIRVGERAFSPFTLASWYLPAFMTRASLAAVRLPDTGLRPGRSGGRYLAHSDSVAIQELNGKVGQLTTAVQDLTTAVNTVRPLSKRQLHQVDSLLRASLTLQGIEDKVGVLERRLQQN